MEARRQELDSTRVRELSAGVTSAELRFRGSATRNWCGSAACWSRNWCGSNSCAEEQREIFQQARRAREMLERVRDRQLRVYQKQAARREQRRLDDLFLLQREYLRRG